MQRYLTISAVLLCVFSAPRLLAGDESNSVDGSLLAGGRTYKLAYGVAYESKSDDDATITVVVSDRKISVATIKAALCERKSSGEQLSLAQPHLTIRLNPSGKPVGGYAATGSAYFGFFGSALKGDLKIEDGRIRGRTRLETQGEGVFERNFDVRLDVALGLDGSPKPAAKPAGPVKASVNGTFKGNGTRAQLAYVSVRRGEPFGAKPTLVLVFTEKDHSAEKKPEVKAGFGYFGSALVITAYDDGKIVGCEVAHSAHAKKPFSSIGNVTTHAFEVGDGRVEGHISSEGEVNTFDQKWEIEIKFTAPFSEPASKAVADPTPPKKNQRSKSAAKAEPEKRPAAALNVKNLPLPEDATDVERRKIVKQIVCKSPSPVQALADELTKKLADQGWTGDDSDLVNASAAILKRTLGEASLTIMVKTAGNGSRVIIFTKGLDWEEPKSSK